MIIYCFYFHNLKGSTFTILSNEKNSLKKIVISHELQKDFKVNIYYHFSNTPSELKLFSCVFIFKDLLFIWKSEFQRDKRGREREIYSFIHSPKQLRLIQAGARSQELLNPPWDCNGPNIWVIFYQSPNHVDSDVSGTRTGTQMGHWHNRQ